MAKNSIQIEYSSYWQPVYGFYVQAFASKHYKASESLSNDYSCYLSDE